MLLIVEEVAVAVESDAAVAKALAAPTRAALLDLLRASGPLTAKEAADRSGIHANVARGHLDILTSAGLVRTSWRRNAAGGRPARMYEAAPAHVEEGTQLVATILAALLELAAPDPAVARKVAETAGERLGRRFGRSERDGLPVSFAEQADALLRALGSVSGGVRIAGRGDDWVEFEDLDCPFKGIAVEHPEIACALDKALKEGIMRGLGADAYVEQVTSIAWGDPSCREVVRLRRADRGDGAHAS